MGLFLILFFLGFGIFSLVKVGELARQLQSIVNSVICFVCVVFLVIDRDL